MNGQGVGQILFFVGALIALAYPLGLWMARVYGTSRALGSPLRALEGGFYPLVGAQPREEQDWKSYAQTVLVFSAVFTVLLYGFQRLQAWLFLNPDQMKAVPPHLAVNTAVSFVTNTSWQFYGGESTMSYLIQTAGIAVQMFVSAAVGMAVLVAVIRGIARRSATELGNFWVDFYRSLAGLLIGRTPEYLGKKIDACEVKFAALGALFVPVLVLTLTAVTVTAHAGLRSVFNPGAHGFTESLYAWTSMANTNGSAFAGFGGTTFTASLGTVAMIFGRFVPLVAALALGGSLVGKRVTPASVGTLRTEGPTFTTLLVGMIVLTSGLMILPALTLGPIVEGLAH